MAVVNPVERPAPTYGKIVKRALPGDPPHLKLAFTYHGLKEEPGAEHNQQAILELFHELGHHWVTEDETNWCAVFVGNVLKKTGLPFIPSMAARAYQHWGKEVQTPARGDIVVFWRVDAESWQGHVGFYIGESRTHIYVLGGNQLNSVSVRGYSRKRLIGYREPVNLNPVTGNSRTMKAQAAAGTGAGLVAASEGVQQIAANLQETGTVLAKLATISPWISVVGVVLILTGVGVSIWARLTDWQEKAR